MGKTTARQFQRDVLADEGIKIVLDCDPDTEVGEYSRRRDGEPHRQKARDEMSLEEFGENRLRHSIGDIGWEAELDDGTHPAKSMRVKTARKRTK